MIVKLFSFCDLDVFNQFIEQYLSLPLSLLECEVIKFMAISKNKVSVVLTPTGNVWGGTTGNKALSELLEDIVGDQEFDGFIRHKAVNAAILNKLLYNEFEEEKKNEYEDDTLYIKYGVVETRLFQPTINGIVQCTVASLEELKSRVDTIYIVGEFGGCRYIYKKLEESFFYMQ